MVGIASLPIGELNLPPEVLRAILEAVKAKENKQLPSSTSNVIDVPQRKLIEAKVT